MNEKPQKGKSLFKNDILCFTRTFTYVVLKYVPPIHNIHDVNLAS